jgi:hypothetical protein
MSRKISLHIGGRTFDLDVDNEFAPYLEKNMSKDFNIDGHNDLKKLVHAYVKKNHELYMQEKEVKRILAKLEKQDKL